MLQACADRASHDLPFSDVHHLIAEDEWVCVQYLIGQRDASPLTSLMRMRGLLMGLQRS